jgi:hypothetical protein
VSVWGETATEFAVLRVAALPVLCVVRDVTSRGVPYAQSAMLAAVIVMFCLATWGGVTTFARTCICLLNVLWS